MIKHSADRSGRGWFGGPWDSDIPVAIGYADEGADDPHVHDSMYEIYFIALGSSTAVVDGQRIDLKSGDVLVVEPGEAHTFVASSNDYLHFVVQAPFVKGDKRTA